MNSYYDHQYWRNLWAPNGLRRAVVISLLAHVVLGLVVLEAFKHRRPLPSPVTYNVQFIPVSPPEPPKEVQAPVPPEPEPEPEPPKPTPEPPKEEPTPKPKPEPEPPKPRPKPKPKPKPEAKPKTIARPDEPQQTGISMKQELPSALDAWGRRVQRKVEKYWQIPGGIRLDLDNNSATVSFGVGRRGNLIGEPEVVEDAGDPALGRSGVRAIKLAAPLPPLPDDYEATQQQVVYVFSLVR